MRSHEENPFLHGNFAPVHDERADAELEVVGLLPEELDGTLLRNGPNPRFAPLGTYHWFDGDGMLHAIRMQGGKVSYRNRWVRTREFTIEEQEGRAIWRGIEEPPDFQNPHGIIKNRSNTSVVFHAGKLLSLWEGGAPYEVDPTTLETRGKHTFGGKLSGSFTAHPKVDSRTGEMFAFSYSPFPPFLRYFVISAAGELVQSQVVDLKAPVMMHDFAITQHYALFFDSPAVMRPERLLQKKSFVNWEPERGARIGVMPRHGKASEIRWFDVPPFYMYHAANAYEHEHTIVLTGGRMAGTFMVAQDEAIAEDSKVDNVDVGLMWRFCIDLETGQVREEKLDDAPIGFETVSEARVGLLARYNYAALLRSTRPVDGAAFIGLRKYDLEHGTHQTHAFEEGVLGGEGVFVPRRDAKSEDDGYMLVLTYDERHARSELRVFSARTFEAEPLARVRFARRIPHGFHARWLPRVAG